MGVKSIRTPVIPRMLDSRFRGKDESGGRRAIVKSSHPDRQDICEIGSAMIEGGRRNDDEWRREMLSKMDKFESRMDRLESKVDNNQWWTIGLLVIILIAIIGSNWIG